MSGQAGAVTERERLFEGNINPHKQQHDIIGQFGDLSDKAARAILVKAMVVNYALSSFDLDSYAFERGIARLPHSTVSDIIATFAEALESDSERTALLLKGFKIGCVSKHVL